MQQLFVTFVEIFDVVRVNRPATRSTVGEKKTLFGFECQSGKRHNVSINGNPRLEAGMSVVAVLARDDDWHSLVGWVNKATGEIAGPEPINLPLVMVAVSAGVLGCILASISEHPYFALAFGAATIGVGVWVRRGAELYRMLAVLRRRSDHRAP